MFNNLDITNVRETNQKLLISTYPARGSTVFSTHEWLKF